MWENKAVVKLNSFFWKNVLIFNKVRQNFKKNLLFGTILLTFSKNWGANASSDLMGATAVG